MIKIVSPVSSYHCLSLVRSYLKQKKTNVPFLIHEFTNVLALKRSKIIKTVHLIWFFFFLQSFNPGSIFLINGHLKIVNTLMFLQVLDFSTKKTSLTKDIP